jgi:hypothetical protein
VNPEIIPPEEISILAAMPVGKPSNPALIERVRRMMLLEYKPGEMQPALAAALGKPVSMLEIEECRVWISQEWLAMPEANELKQELNEHWARSKMLRGDMLSMYEDLRRHHQYTMLGQVSFPDGAPVIATKASEITGLAEKILKFDEAAVISRVSAFKSLTGLLQPRMPAPLTGGQSALEMQDEDQETVEETILVLSQPVLSPPILGQDDGLV